MARRPKALLSQVIAGRQKGLTAAERSEISRRLRFSVWLCAAIAVLFFVAEGLFVGVLFVIVAGTLLGTMALLVRWSPAR